ncbi:MAG TPA: calcium-binding protein, partial [Vampirovibrionales bacterium]
MAVIQGTPFDDTLLGSAGNDFIYGWQGNDVLTSANGDDVLYGDEGNDSLTGGNDNDLLAGSQGDDTVNGEAGNDILYGGQGKDVLIGGLGSDRLFGDSGLDRLYLESGADTVTGGKDKDSFILFPTLGGNSLLEAAIITDFNPLEDALELVGGLTLEGLNIFQGTENYANDTIIQDRSTGRYLAILLNVATPSLIQEKITENPTEPTAEDPQQPPIIFAGPSLGTPSTPPTTTPPVTVPGNQPDDTLPGNQPDDTLPGNQPDDTLPGNQPDDTLPGNQPDDTLPGNDTPSNIILSNTSISENSADGTMIATLSTVDPDEG